MKKRILLASLLLPLINETYGQYGTRKYQHNGTFITSAKATNNTNGFVMAAANPWGANPGPGIVIDKVDINGNFSSSSEFSMEYVVNADPNCSGLTTPFYGTNAVDIVESNSGASEKYAIAGAFDRGVFFATLFGNGFPTGVTTYWPFGSGGATKRPMIRAATNGDYFICWKVQTKGYIVRLSNVGVPIWCKTVTNMNFEPNALIQSPVNSNELVVVGRCDYNTTTWADAFFLKLNANNGAILTFKTYNDGTGGDEWFSSIEPANSTTGGAGYVLGGWVGSYAPSLAGKTAWMAKLDYNGNVIWSSVAPGSYDVKDVTERWNPFNSNWEYFGIALTQEATSIGSNDITVWKLNDFGASPFMPAKFVYNRAILVAGVFDASIPQIEISGNGSSTPNDGLLNFTTDYNANPANLHVLGRSYFNGVDGCDASTDLAVATGPGVDATPALTTANYGNWCTYLQLSYTPITTQNLQYCNWGLWGWGDNTRTRSVGISDQEPNGQDISAFPNPTNGTTTIEVNNSGSATTLSIANSLGEIIKVIEIPSASTIVSVDFKELRLEEGLYLVTVSNASKTSTTKVIYQK
jgi:hypothetical protein